MKRLLSLHYLRGISALMVLYAHVVVSGITDPVTPRLYWPMIPGPALPAADFSLTGIFLQPAYFLGRFGLSPGHLGVGIFFVISGYVILASLQNLSPRQFIVGRFLRIWPLAATVCVIGAAVFSTYITAKGYDSPYRVSQTILSTFLLPSEFPPIPVIWSLIVEVWFYVVIGVVFFCSGRSVGFLKITGIGVLSLVVVAICAALHYLVPEMHVYSRNSVIAYRFTAYHFTFITCILIGSIVYIARTSGKIIHGVAAAIAMMSFFALNSWVFTNFMGAGPLGFDIQNIFAATAIVVIFLIVERFIPKSKVLGFFADISYPLYLVHIPIAWIILHYFHVKGFSGQVGLMAATVVPIGLAYLLHRVIERPSHEIGRRIASGNFRRPL